MRVVLRIIEAVKRRLLAAREAHAAAEREARALLSRGSCRQALHELRQWQQREGDDAGVRRRIEAIRVAVFRLSKDQRRADTATRMHYRDLR